MGYFRSKRTKRSKYWSSLLSEKNLHGDKNWPISYFFQSEPVKSKEIQNETVVNLLEAYRENKNQMKIVCLRRNRCPIHLKYKGLAFFVAPERKFRSSLEFVSIGSGKFKCRINVSEAVFKSSTWVGVIERQTMADFLERVQSFFPRYDSMTFILGRS